MDPKTLLTKTALTAGAFGMLATAGAATASAASASTTQRHEPARVAYGSVELGSPLQYEQFLALQGFGRHHGTVDYTNWTYAEPGSGVYAPAGETAPGHVTTPIGLTFTYKNTLYAHTLNGGLQLTALSPDKLAFSGTGSSGKTTWKIDGQVRDSKFRATIAYDGQSYTVVMRGTIASDGSVSGTALDSQGQALTFTMPAGSFTAVLHFIAPIRSDQMRRHNASFQFVIPSSVPGLAGVEVTVNVHDGGRGPVSDTYAHNGSSYPIIGGPGITIR
jgi:hypothetical protein